MKILGISSNYHDASAALVVDGRVVAGAAEERFSLIKHDPSFPYMSSRFCTEFAGIQFSDLDYLAYHEDPNIKFTRTLSSSFSNFPFSVKTYIKSMKEAITSGMRIKHQLSSNFDLDPSRIIFVPHHMSHAAHSFYGSPFKESAILTLDAVGEWTCTAIFKGENENIEPLDGVFFPHSLGLIYSTFTAFLGFKANDGECSTMALAAFGEPSYADDIRQIIQIKNNGKYEIDLSYFNFGSEERIPITDKFVKIFGEPRPYKEVLQFDCFLDENKIIDNNQKRYADIAASIQLVLEEAILALVGYTKEITKCENLCLSGGVALNAVANSKILASKIFKDVFISPDPGDGGGAMGAAMCASVNISGERIIESLNPYYGQSYCEEATVEMLKHIKIEDVFPFSKVKDNYQLNIGRIEGEKELCTYVADQIHQGKIVGWFQDRFENGPRALGNRSLLIDPANTEIAKKLSQNIKLRASFRPYAISVTSDHYDKVLEEGSNSRPAKWMQTSVNVNSQALKSIRAAIHADKTTRPQVCYPTDNPLYYKLLKEIGKKTGLEAVLNTSFNESGWPLVASPNEALTMFLRTDMDVLVLNKSIIERKRM